VRVNPRSCHARRADVVLGVLLIVVGIYSLVLLPFSPSQLGTHTILWEALRGSTASIITGGALVHVGSASIFTVVLASLVGTIHFDWLYWWGGAHAGDSGGSTSWSRTSPAPRGSWRASRA